MRNLRENLKTDRSCQSRAEKREGEIKLYRALREKITFRLRKKHLFSFNVGKIGVNSTNCLETSQKMKNLQCYRDDSVSRLLSSHLAELLRQRVPA